MGVGLCTYDATATEAVETMTTQAVFDEGLSCTKQRVSVGSFTWLHHDRFMFFPDRYAHSSLFVVFSEWRQRFIPHVIGWMRITVHFRICSFHAQKCAPLILRCCRWLLQPTLPTTATQALAASRMSRQWKCRDCPATSAVPSATALAAAQVTCRRVTPPLLSVHSAPLPVTSTALWFASLIPTVVAEWQYSGYFFKIWVRDSGSGGLRQAASCRI